MDKIDRSRIENNSLKEEIEKILQLRKEAEAENNDRFSFDAPIDEEEMTSWEQETGITIPESYKEWLRFSRECRIDGATANFWGPKKFHSQYVPDDLVVIGSVIGDGEDVCFSKESGHFVRFFEGRRRRERENFQGILNDIIDFLKPQPLSPEEIEQMRKKLMEIRERRNKQ